MAIKKHVFISPSGAMLSGWRMAFPQAVVYKTGASPDLSEADFIWLRLQSGRSVDQQIALLGENTGKASLIFLSDTPNDQEAMNGFARSARGYANSHAGSETLQQIAKVIDQGGLWVGESLMQRLMLGMQQMPPPLPANPVSKLTTPHLTARELEVAKAIAAGNSNKEVARQLNITERTVKAHVSGLFTKLAVQDRLQLALKMRDLA